MSLRQCQTAPSLLLCTNTHQLSFPPLVYISLILAHGINKKYMYFPRLVLLQITDSKLAKECFFATWFFKSIPFSSSSRKNLMARQFEDTAYSLHGLWSDMKECYVDLEPVRESEVGREHTT